MENEIKIQLQKLIKEKLVCPANIEGLNKIINLDVDIYNYSI